MPSSSSSSSQSQRQEQLTQSDEGILGIDSGGSTKVLELSNIKGFKGDVNYTENGLDSSELSKTLEALGMGARETVDKVVDTLQETTQVATGSRTETGLLLQQIAGPAALVAVAWLVVSAVKG